MKKNKFLRLASVLIILCLITTCAVSGTFAKYTTGADSQDTARVAKWGVEVSVKAQEAFGDKYNDKFDAAGTKVVSIGGDVVAPGTNGQLVEFKISGDPEVAVDLDLVVTNIAGDAAAQDIFVKTGTYTDWTAKTASDTYATYDLASDYYPIVYTLTKDGAPVATGNLAAIEEAIENISAEFDAGADAWDTVCGTYKVTWEWEFDGVDDKTDTLLGNIAAGKEITVASANYSTVIDFKLAITATQID